MSNQSREAQLSQVCLPPRNQPMGTKDRPAQCRYEGGRLFLSVSVHSNSAVAVRIVSGHPALRMAKTAGQKVRYTEAARHDGGEWVAERVRLLLRSNLDPVGI
jgi:hypothetical protein